MNEHSIRETRSTYFQKAASTLGSMLSSTDAAIWPQSLRAQFQEAAGFFATRTKYFQIALCGLFQTGKSTTANAIADGREISVASLISGIRTSACNIYFSGSEDEQSSIEFIDDAELCARLSALLGIFVAPDKLWHQKTKNRLMQLFRQQWDDMLSGSGDGNDSLVRQAGLLICGLDSFQELRRDIQKGNHVIQDVLRIGQAPEDEDLRWQQIRNHYKNDPDHLAEYVRRAFPIQDVLYPFVNRITVQVNSDWMKHTNICIVDMPGISANAQDTNTAMKAIENADALMYIFDGAKEPSELERQFISTLQSVSRKCPVLFGVNWHNSQNAKIKTSIQSLLQSNGYGDTELISYNALLACRAAQGSSIMSGILDQRTSEKIFLSAETAGTKTDSLSAAWAALVFDEMYQIDKNAAREIGKKGPCDETIAELQRLSGWKNVIKALSQMAGGEQWQAIYRRQIRVPIEAYIKSLSEALHDAEKHMKSSAESKLTSESLEWSERSSKMEQIKQQKKADFMQLVNNGWISAIAEEMWDKIEKVLPDIALLITELCVDPDRQDSISEKMEKEFRSAFSSWKDEFLHHGLGSSAKVIYDCEKHFVQLQFRDETIQNIWTQEVNLRGSLWDKISSDIRKTPLPLDTNGSANQYLSEMIDNCIQYITASSSFRSYYAAKSSWNPFNRDQRIHNAKDSLYQDILSRLRGTYKGFRAQAIRSVQEDPNAEPRHLYDISIKWMNSILNGATKSCENMRSKAQKSTSKDSQLQGYAWNRCRIQLNKLRQITIAAKY